MSLRDAVTNALANLWRMKLRSTLTISGIAIAIATFIAMLSFGVGMQRNIEEQFEKLGLFTTLQVYPAATEGVVRGDGPRPVLDAAAIRTIVAIPGVRLAYPFQEFNVRAVLGDSVVATTAQALPVAAARTRLYSALRAGTTFAGDSARQALVSEPFLKQAGIATPEAAVGRSLIVTTRVASLDSALARTVSGGRRELVGRFRAGWPDSIAKRDYWRKLGRDLATAGLSGFVDGLMNARRDVTDTLVVSGVLDGRSRGRSRMAAIVIPQATAARLSAGDIPDDPAGMMAMFRTGAFPGARGGAGSVEFPRVTVDLDPTVPDGRVKAAIEALGYRTFSYADEFKEIRRFFLYFTLGLGLVGGIALLTASLGVVNTMVMSILERTREIGVLKSLGATDRDIQSMFLVESGLIGAAGSAAGILVGWLITRVAAQVARRFMINEGVPPFDLFAFPAWLILGALGFGILVSLAAGQYPAARAARVDPVEALRHD